MKRRAVRWTVAGTLAVATTGVLMWLGMPFWLAFIVGGVFGGVVTSEVVVK